MKNFVDVVMNDVLSIPETPSQHLPKKYTHDEFPFVEIGNFSGFFPNENYPALQNDWLFSIHGNVHAVHYLSETLARDEATKKALLLLSADESAVTFA